MRIGDVNQDNYAAYMKLFSKNKDVKSLSLKAQVEKTAPIAVDPEDSERIMPGMSIHNKSISELQKTTDVSNEVREKIINTIRKDFINNYGMSDGEKYRAIAVEYIKSRPPEERLAVSWTLDRIFGEEGKRLGEIVREKISSWQPGQPFDRSILADAASGSIFDKKI